MEVAEPWTLMLDEASGRYYYYNTQTWEVSWDPPQAIYSEEAVNAEMQKYYENVDQEEAEQGEDEVADWVEAYDETTGAVYYYNNVTGDTSWEYPYAQQPAEEDAVDPAIDQFEMANEAAQWYSALDESSGLVYYANSVTGETQWDLPACFQTNNSSTYNAQDTQNSEASLAQSISTIEEYDPSKETPFPNSKMLPKAKRSNRHSISGAMTADELTAEIKKNMLKSQVPTALGKSDCSL